MYSSSPEKVDSIFMIHSIALDTFLDMSTSAVVELTKIAGQPRLGVFVPDGSRRFALAFSDFEPGSDTFLKFSAEKPAESLLESLQVFFSHGLQALLVPILSKSVIGRGKGYRQHTALTGLKLIFSDPKWIDFYMQHDVKVKVYGNPGLLSNTVCEPALEWIAECSRITASNQRHKLFYAIGESPELGDDAIRAGIDFFQANGRYPSRAELISQYYGEDLSVADFFIMTSKMSGLGALPTLLINGNTDAYFLPAVSSMGLNQETFRRILYDMILRHASLSGDYTNETISIQDRQDLKQFYEQSITSVIGLGQIIGGVWVPNATLPLT